MTRALRRTAFALAAAAMLVSDGTASQPTVTIPEFWGEELLRDYELPLATPENTPQHVSRDYYYALAEHTAYKSYPIYHPSREPAGYWDKLWTLEPERIFDPATLKTEADWIAAGRAVFETPIDYDDAEASVRLVRDPAWYERHRVPLAADGTMPFARYVVRRKGVIEVGNLACAMCHTRVLPGGLVVAGAQGNFPVDAYARELVPNDVGMRFLIRLMTAAPWDKALTERTRALTIAQVRSLATPPGVSVRQGTSVFAPAAIPDLIGLRDRRYLDRTGLGRHRGPADLMRYAALNQGMDLLSNYGGLVPIANDMKTLPPPGRTIFAGSNFRYSDAQLYALAQYIYSLTPPPNPNPFDDRARRGEAVFTASGCARCHTPPLYTANKLVPADGFTPPADHYKKYDIVDERIGTDPTLTLSTRRGTGYYKIPSLRGVWYRGPFEHNGSVATLEDWFNPARLKDDYVPTGWVGAGVKTRAVKGHPFGLSLSADDRAALIAFLKTL